MIHKIIAERKSTVLFSSKPLQKEMLVSLFDAARRAPSSMNQQPWRFVYAVKEDEFHYRLLECLNLNNREWAKNAPLLIAVIAQVISDYNNKPNIYAWHDTAMAYANLVFQATALGLHAHPMGGFDKHLTIQYLNIPEEYEPVIYTALGYKSEDPENFPAKLVKREQQKKTRHGLSEFVYHGKFRNKTELLI